jgi:hypothetical protein
MYLLISFHFILCFFQFEGREAASSDGHVKLRKWISFIKKKKKRRKHRETKKE